MLAFTHLPTPPHSMQSPPPVSVDWWLVLAVGLDSGGFGLDSVWFGFWICVGFGFGFGFGIGFGFGTGLMGTSNKEAAQVKGSLPFTRRFACCSHFLSLVC